MTKIKAHATDKTLRHGIHVEFGLGTPDQISDEIQDMINVLLDRVNSPIDPENALALMEVADAYYMRASELTYKIHRLERQGKVNKGDELYKLRTGELADFLEACKRSIETGSRRLSALQLEHEQAKMGRAG
jgi:hypothetical protein